MRKRKKVMSFLFAGGFLLVAVCVYYFCAFYPTFNSLDKREEFLIPGLEDGFVPQGLDYDKDNDVFLMCGYMSDGSPSRLYVIDEEESKFVTLKKDGESYLGHCGGVATDGFKVWISGDKEVQTLDYSEIINSSNGASLEILDTKKTGNGCDFIDVVDGRLWIGEFYRKNKYETPMENRVNGSNALLYAYKIDHDNTSGFEELEFCLTLPNNAQGIVNLGEKIVVSTSWSIPSSKIMVYENPLKKEAAGEVFDVPLYELNDKNLMQSILAPTMTEELTEKAGRVYINFESACKKYKFINRTRIKYVLSIEV